MAAPTDAKWAPCEPIARGPGESLHPNLWNGLAFAYYPHLVGGGTKMLDFGPHARHAEFHGGLAVGDWQNGPYGRCVNLAGGNPADPTTIHCWQWGASGSAWNTAQTGHFLLSFATMNIVALCKPNVSTIETAIYGRAYNVGAANTPLTLIASTSASETAQTGMHNWQGSFDSSAGRSASSTGEWITFGGIWPSTDKPSFWENGIKIRQRATAHVPSPPMTNTAPHAIGRHAHATVPHEFDGVMGPVVIHDRGLEESEMRLLMDDPFAPIRQKAYHLDNM